MAIIKNLKNFFTGDTIFPITKTKAVYDDSVGRLDQLLQRYVGEADILETTEGLPRDADTLGGKTAEQYQAEIDALVSENEKLRSDLTNKVQNNCRIQYKKSVVYYTANTSGQLPGKAQVSFDGDVKCVACSFDGYGDFFSCDAHVANKDVTLTLRAITPLSVNCNIYVSIIAMVD